MAAFTKPPFQWKWYGCRIGSDHSINCAQAIDPLTAVSIWLENETYLKSIFSMYGIITGQTKCEVYAVVIYSAAIKREVCIVKLQIGILSYGTRYFFKWAIPGFVFLYFVFSTLFILNQWIKFCRWLDSIVRPLVSEATALPNEPHPLPSQIFTL